MTDMYNLYNENKTSTITPDSIFGDYQSYNGELSEHNQNSISKKLEEFSELSNNENFDMEVPEPDIEVDNGKLISVVPR
jgi:hypothetical protein